MSYVAHSSRSGLDRSVISLETRKLDDEVAS